jgi:hypothetical protein
MHRELDWRLATEGNGFFFYFFFFFFLPEKRILKRPAVGASSRIAMINKRYGEEEETTAPSPPPSTPRSIDKFAHSKRDELQNTQTHKRDRREIARRTRIGSLPHEVSKHGNECRLPISGIPNQPEESLLACLPPRARDETGHKNAPNAAIIEDRRISSALVIARRRRRGGMLHTEREMISRAFSVTMEKLVFRVRRFLCCVADLSLSL